MKESCLTRDNYSQTNRLVDFLKSRGPWYVYRHSFCSAFATFQTDQKKIDQFCSPSSRSSPNFLSLTFGPAGTFGDPVWTCRNDISRDEVKSVSKTLLILTIIVGAPLVLGQVLVAKLPFAEVQSKADLTVSQVKQLDIYVESIKLLITLTSLLFGGFAFYFKLAGNDQDGLRFIEASAILAGVSIYFGYISYSTMVWMLSKHFFDLDTPILSLSRLLQVGTFLTSIGCFYLAWSRSAGPKGGQDSEHY